MHLTPTSASGLPGSGQECPQVYAARRILAARGSGPTARRHPFRHAPATNCSGGIRGDHRYIDGGYRSNADNADMAAGYERVLVRAGYNQGRALARQLTEFWG